jgi:aldose 1-epimerase
MSITITTAGLEATFHPELGMVGTSVRWEGNEFLALLPGGLQTYREGHQTGLPLLAPWANRLGGHRYRVGDVDVDVDLSGLELHADGNGLPIHGTMTAASGWQVTARDADHVRARFDYGADRPELLAAFPFPHVLELEARICGGALVVTTILRPTTDRAVPVAFGYHPYLRLPVSDRETWRLRLPEREHLALDDRGLPTGSSVPEPAEDAPIGNRTFDDLYALGADRELALESDEHRLAVRYEQGYPYAQVFVPAGQQVVALEPMTAPTNALGSGSAPLVAPGDSFTARFSISVA